MNETERRIARHLHHLAAEAPEVDLVDAARAIATVRRAWATPALAAAAVVILVAVGAIVVPRGGAGDNAPVVASPEASASASTGQRLVGTGDLAVMVPAELPLEGYSCTPLARSTVVVRGGVERSCLRGAPTGSVLEVSLGAVVVETPKSATRTLAGGLRVTVTERTLGDGRLEISVYSSSSDLGIKVDGPATQVRTVINSLRPVPSGSVVVPVVDKGWTSRSAHLREITRQYEAAGLNVELEDEITRQRSAHAKARESLLEDLGGGLTSDIQSGTVVRRGTTVTLADQNTPSASG